MSKSKNKISKDRLQRVMFDSALTRADDAESNIYEFVVSDTSPDRHGTAIKDIAGVRFENFNKNGVVSYQHELHARYNQKPDPDFVIGKGSLYGDKEGRLIGRVEFEPKELNKLADKIRRKVDFGSLKATSIGFIPIRGHWGVIEDDEDSGTYYFDEIEIIEFSIVNIPSNPNALKRSAAFDDYLKGQKKASDSVTKSSAGITATKIKLSQNRRHLLGISK